MSDARSGAETRPENRLIDEKSPYLLQHAHNPVDWFPWGDEAFAEARRRSAPLFVSIGYSTCHWCHVMERESFEDDGVAQILNRDFVPVKVDREERPDIDQAYMAVCEMLTGHGGWPLTVVLTPDGKPFFAGTYFPRESRFGRPGLLDLLPRLAQAWREKREDVAKSAGEIARLASGAGREGAAATPRATADEGMLRAGFGELDAAFDERHGGFGTRPKFPQPHGLMFLLRYWSRYGEDRALAMVERTLEAMAAGGIQDQLGGGFHRYSTDERWFLPHFEKMLYDQALLAMAYSEAFAATGKETYRAVADGVFDYVLRDMTSPEGAFYSSEDADSEGVEGKFYVFTAAEIRDALPPADAQAFIEAYGVSDQGNFRDEATGERNGANVLHLAGWPGAAAPGAGASIKLAAARRTLFELREKRVRPARDDKVLTDWNGLMIAAMAHAARAFGDLRYANAAGRAAGFILHRLARPDGTLLHRYRDGQSGIAGFLDDYAFLGWGLLELYFATFNLEHLETALRLARRQLELFSGSEEEGPGLRFVAATDPGVGERPVVGLGAQKPAYDGAVPSGNAVTMYNLLRLARLTGRAELEEKASDIAVMLAGQARHDTWGHTFFLLALDYALGPSSEVVLAGELDAPDSHALLEALEQGFRPRQVLLHLPRGGPARDRLVAMAPFTETLASAGPRALAYICSGGQCLLPVTDPAQLPVAPPL